MWNILHYIGQMELNENFRVFPFSGASARAWVGGRKSSVALRTTWSDLPLWLIVITRCRQGQIYPSGLSSAFSCHRQGHLYPTGLSSCIVGMVRFTPLAYLYRLAVISMVRFTPHGLSSSRVVSSQIYPSGLSSSFIRHHASSAWSDLPYDITRHWWSLQPSWNCFLEAAICPKEFPWPLSTASQLL